jgi:tetratricopeptide (TPR) repeat protein/transcriptional regulator with XRE-family HTH domain
MQRGGRVDSTSVLFGQELRRLRQQHELSLRDLAQVVNFTPGYLSKVENGRPPSLELARACDAALSADGTLIALASAEESVRPAQLPASIFRFVGRSDQLSRLDAALTGTSRPGNPNVMIIDGPPGAGKTMLALRWAHHVVDRFPDGQLYVDLRGHSSHERPVSPGAVLEEFLATLGVPASGVPAGLDRSAALYRSLLASRRMLVVLDNAADSAQVEPLLPASAECAVVITSRERLSSVAVHTDALRVTLGPMTESESIALIGKVIGVDRGRAEPDAVADLAARCGYLPLALRIAAERVVTQPHYSVRDLVDELDVEGRLDALATFDSIAVRTVFGWSYRRLDQRAARMFRVLGLHPGSSISTGAAAALAAVPMSQARALLERLASAHLIQGVARDRYQLHDLLREYAGELAVTEETAEEREAAADRLTRWYLRTICVAGSTLAPFRMDILEPEPLEPPLTALRFDSDAAALRWCDAEQPNFVQVIQLAVDNRLYETAWQLAVGLWSYLLLRKPWTIWERTHQLALRAAIDAGDANAEGWVATNLAEAYRRMGEFRESEQLYARALKLRQEGHDRHGEAWSLSGSAFLAMDRGDPARAAEHAARALAIFREVDDQQGVGVALATLGDVHRSEGRLDEALAVLNDSLAVHERIGSLGGKSWVLVKIADVHVDRGQQVVALRELDQALVACQGARDRWGEAETLSRSGDILLGLGRVPEAQRSWEAALTLYEEVGDNPRATNLRSRIRRSG